MRRDQGERVVAAVVATNYYAQDLPVESKLGKEYHIATVRLDI